MNLKQYKREIKEIYDYVLDPETKCLDTSYITLAPLYLIVEKKSQMKGSFCAMLFEKDYPLNMEKRSKNRILHAIFGLIVEVERSGKVTGNLDLATLLLESLSPSRGISEENTMRVLLIYARELIKTLKTDDYKSGIIGKLEKQLNRKKEEDRRYDQRKRFPTQFAIPEKEIPCFEGMSNRMHETGVQMIYSGVIKSFKE